MEGIVRLLDFVLGTPCLEAQGSKQLFITGPVLLLILLPRSGVIGVIGVTRVKPR